MHIQRINEEIPWTRGEQVVIDYFHKEDLKYYVRSAPLCVDFIIDLN
jgi:hypothetical protein